MKEFNDAFESVFGPNSDFSKFFGDSWFAPKIDQPFFEVVEDAEDKNILNLQISLPGYTREEFDVTQSNGVLTVQSVSQPSGSEEFVEWVADGVKKCSFVLTFEVKPNQLVDAATFVNGILNIKVINNESDDTRNIPVN